MRLLSILWLFLFIGWSLSEVAILLITRTRAGGGEIQDRGSLRVLWLVIFLSICLGTWYGDSHPHTLFQSPWAAQYISLALIITGLCIRFTAIAQLGKSFSANVAIHSTQTVYKSGLFRILRHPSYTGMLFNFAAIGLRTRNWGGLAILVIPPTAALLYRIHVEEAALLNAFGADYADYASHTRRLIPGIY